MIKKTTFFKIGLLILASAFFAGACQQAATPSLQPTSNNLLIQTRPESVNANSFTQTSPTLPNVNQAVAANDTSPSPSRFQETGKVQRVQFARGRTSATFKDAVYQNKDNQYLFAARAGQTLTVLIKVEQNRKSPDANDDVALEIEKVGESEPFAKLDSNFWRGQLPETSEYVIRVISFTESNNYTLKVEIR